MSSSSVESLRDRYRSRYGEDLEVPDAFNVPLPSRDEDPVLVSTDSTDELSTVTVESPSLASPAPEKPAKVKPKIYREPTFWDLRSAPLYLFKKAELDGSGGAAKALWAIIDVVVLILVPLTLILVPLTAIRLITSVLAWNKEKKQVKETTASA
jgi:hypothetical protein